MKKAPSHVATGLFVYATDRYFLDCVIFLRKRFEPPLGEFAFMSKVLRGLVFVNKAINAAIDTNIKMKTSKATTTNTAPAIR